MAVLDRMKRLAVGASDYINKKQNQAIRGVVSGVSNLANRASTSQGQLGLAKDAVNLPINAAKAAIKASNPVPLFKGAYQTGKEDARRIATLSGTPVKTGGGGSWSSESVQALKQPTEVASGSSDISSPIYSSTAPTYSPASERAMEMVRQSEMKPTTPVPTTVAPTPVAPTSNAVTPPPVAQSDKAMEALRAKLVGLTGMSEDERRLADELAQFRGSASQGIAGLEGQGRGIPLALIRGQQAKLGEQAALQEQTLMDRLGVASADRQARLQAAGLEQQMMEAERARQDQLTAPTTVGNKVIRFNPATNSYDTLYEAPATQEDLPATAQEYEYAKKNGYVGSFMDYQAEKNALSSSGDGAFTLGNTRYDAQGNIIAQAPGTTGASSATEGERAGAGFYNRAVAAEQALTNLGGNVSGKFLQGVLPNQLQSAEYQQFKQAGEDFIKAVLRAESGASIPADEMESYFKTYFPQPGDKPETLKQKAASRQRQIESLKIEAGRALQGGGEITDIDSFLDSFSDDLSRSQNGSFVSVPLGNKKIEVSSQIADRLAKADAEYYRATGKHIQVSEGRRSRERQAELYARYKSGKGGRAAPPGKSFHETGNAIDVSGDWKSAEPYLRKYGFKNELADDKHHFSYLEFT